MWKKACRWFLHSICPCSTQKDLFNSFLHVDVKSFWPDWQCLTSALQINFPDTGKWAHPLQANPAADNLTQIFLHILASND